MTGDRGRSSGRAMSAAHASGRRRRGIGWLIGLDAPRLVPALLAGSILAAGLPATGTERTPGPADRIIRFSG
jgi:hypothetical protein